MQSTLDIQPRDGRSNRSPLHQIKLKQATTEFQKETVKKIIRTYHSYVPQHRTYGRKIDWLIYRENKCLGSIGLCGCTTFEQKDRDAFLGWTRSDRKLNIEKGASNYRFTLIEHLSLIHI